MWQRLITDVTEVINNEAFLNLVVKNNIDKVTENEQKLYTKIIYGVVENKKWIDFLLRPYCGGKRFKPYPKNALRIGVYALSYLSLAKFYVVNSLVDVVKKKDYNASKAINSILRSFIKDERVTKAKKELDKLPLNEKESIIYNIDIEVLKLIKSEYPNDYQGILSPADDTIDSYRINTLKISIDELTLMLDNMKINYTISEDMILSKESLIKTSLFKERLIIPQDTSSAQVAKVLNPPQSSTILDTCSAPGSKSFHLACLMKNKGRIVSCDIYEHKLKLIEEEAKNQGITIIETKLKDASNTIYDELFSYILVDAPCSGMGTMKHKGDLKLRLTIDKIKEIEELQQQILNNVINYLLPRGVLVYSTCTINKDENEKQIEKFLINHPEIEKEEEYSYLPTSQNDGFYICKLIKKG